MSQNANEMKVCKHCQSEIPKKAKVCPQCRKKQKGSLGKMILGIILLFFIFSLFSGGSQDYSVEESVENREYVSVDEIERAIAYPDEYKGKYIKISGRIFATPNTDEGYVAFQMFHDVENSKGNIVVLYETDNVNELDGYEYVTVDGKITGAHSGKNAFGGTITGVNVLAASVEKANYIDVVSPTLKELNVEQVVNQHDYSILVEKVEFAEKETRVYVSVENNGSDKFYFYNFNVKLIQDGNQYEPQYNYDADYEEVQSELLVGAKSSGIIVFPSIDNNKEFKIHIEASSNNWNENFENYVFEVGKE